MRTYGQFVTAVAFGMFLGASFAGGQVSPSQHGRELDANPSLGNRYNYETPSGPSINSQLYVTGQVSGLGYFRGTTAAVAPDTLRMSVPSAGLSDFNRRSVGVADALGGQPYIASPYYDRGRTVFGAESILTGRTAVGSNIPRTSATRAPSTSSFGRQLYIDALADFRTTEAARGARVMAPEAPRRMIDTPAAGTVRSPTFVASPALDRTPSNAMVISDLFGVRNADARDDLARELYLQAHPDQVLGRVEAGREQDGGTSAQVTGGLPGREPLGQGDVTAAPEARTAADANTLKLSGSITRAPGMPSRNQDVFIDMLLTLRQSRQARKLAERAAKNLPMPEALPKPVMRHKPGSLVEVLPNGGMLIHDLAGEGKDMFNLRMSRAGQQLRANQFYEAAYAYDTAGLHDRSNPLAMLGKGLSLLGAGETLTAAFEIERAMRMFPPLAEARVDLSAIMGAEALNAQLQRLDQRMSVAGPEARQRIEFLATFLYYNSNQYDKAKLSAQRLVSRIQADSILRTYAEGVLEETGGGVRKPQPGKADPPAGTPAGTRSPRKPPGMQ